MYATRIGTARPDAVPAWPTVKTTNGPAVKAVLSGVRIIPPGVVCLTHEYGTRPSFTAAVTMTRSNGAPARQPAAPSPQTTVDVHPVAISPDRAWSAKDSQVNNVCFELHDL